MRIVAIVLMLLTVLGCGKSEEQTKEQKEESALASLSPAGGPSEILADVNGSLLRRGNAEIEANFRLRRMKIPPNASPAQQAAAKQRALYHVVDQFIAKTLLSDEADTLEIVISEAEEKAAFDKIQENLPEGQTVEETMNNSPIGKERMRQEVVVGVKIEKLLAQEVGTDFSPSEEEYDTFVAEKGELLSIPENIKAGHILISKDGATNDTGRLEKKQLAEKIRQQLVDGANFAELAAKHSNCQSSRSGGNLGTIIRGRMAPSFEQAAFTQKVGEIGSVVEAPYGFHIIVISEHNDGGPMTKEQITDILIRRKQTQARREYVKALIDKSSIKLAPTVTPPKQPRW